MNRIIKSIVIVLILLFTIFILAGCGNQESKQETQNTIVGVWKYNGGDYTYTFKEDGTGNYKVSNTIMEFSYTTDGNKLSIMYTGNTVPFETEYSIDGKTLNVKDSNGKDTLYTKQ